MPAGERYGGRPVYFSDVIVRPATARSPNCAGGGSPFNEQGSHSGFIAVTAEMGFGEFGDG